MQVELSNHCAMRVARRERDRIRDFYCTVLDAQIMRAGDDKDDLRLGDGFFIAFLYEDDEAVLADADLRKAIYLELQASDVHEARERIVAFGVTVLDVPDPHLYFQAPGGQVFRLVGRDENLARYEGTEHGEQFVGVAFAPATTDGG